MKIDTQGFESKVLKGAENSLMQIDTVQMEMSLQTKIPVKYCRLMAFFIVFSHYRLTITSARTHIPLCSMCANYADR
jgi:hypothetical protein